MSNPESTNAAAWAQHAAVLRAAELEFNLLTAAPPAAPDDFAVILARAGEGWTQLPDAAMTAAMRALREVLYTAPAREDRGGEMWREALATSLFAARIARATDVSVADACAAGLVHRAGEALAMQAIARAEHLTDVELDRGSRSRLILGAELDLAIALLTAWQVPLTVAAIVTGWRQCGTPEKHAADCRSVYFGHAMAVEALHPEFRSPGLLEALAAATGLTRNKIAALRTDGIRLREFLLALG